MADRALNGAIAVTRFGLGARPGEIDEASHDAVGWLQAQIRRDGADQPVSTPLPPMAAPTKVATLPGVAPGTPPQNGPAQPNMAMSQGAVQTSAMGSAAVSGAPVPAPQTVQPPNVLTFDDGQPLPSMQVAFRHFVDYQQAVKGAKGDADLRREASQPIYELAAEEALARARLGAQTPAGFRERWALFWCNHFTVAAKNLDTTVAVGPFEREAIRPRVFGSFAELLLASSMHPGMLLYLDQAQSIGPNSQAGFRRGGGLNENLGREIMELHSVGADGGYTQGDVTEFARALTGWSVGSQRDPAGQTGAFLYRANFHEPGVRKVMGKTYGDDAARQAADVIFDLAASPKTAHRLATKIAAHFVSDAPPPALVHRLEATYMQSGGDLGRVAEALITSPEAFEPQATKLKTPYEFVISSYRAANTAPRNPAKEVVGPLNALGQRPFGAPQPNGWSDVAADWAAPDAIVKRLTWAQGFANANVPQLAPPDEARQALGARLQPATLTAVTRAESRPEAFAILLMSPEFQRR
jgi:uncharacterized protein (DUF1800 family)